MEHQDRPRSWAELKERVLEWAWLRWCHLEPVVANLVDDAGIMGVFLVAAFVMHFYAGEKPVGAKAVIEIIHECSLVAIFLIAALAGFVKYAQKVLPKPKPADPPAPPPKLPPESGGRKPNGSKLGPRLIR